MLPAELLKFLKSIVQSIAGFLRGIILYDAVLYLINLDPSYDFKNLNLRAVRVETLFLHHRHNQKFFLMTK
jgi:hypothetical protein